MPSLSSNLLRVLRLNRGPIQAVAAELSPFLGCAYFGSQIRVILSGETRRSLRQVIGDKAWQFGLVEGPWFSNCNEVFDRERNGEQIHEMGVTLFYGWLTSDPVFGAMTEELDIAIGVALDRIQKSPVTLATISEFNEASVPFHQATKPILSRGQVGRLLNSDADAEEIPYVAPSSVGDSKIIDTEITVGSSLKDAKSIVSLEQSVKEANLPKRAGAWIRPNFSLFISEIRSRFPELESKPKSSLLPSSGIKSSHFDGELK